MAPCAGPICRKPSSCPGPVLSARLVPWAETEAGPKRRGGYGTTDPLEQVPAPGCFGLACISHRFRPHQREPADSLTLWILREEQSVREVGFGSAQNRGLAWPRLTPGIGCEKCRLARAAAPGRADLRQHRAAMSPSSPAVTVGPRPEVHLPPPLWPRAHRPVTLGPAPCPRSRAWIRMVPWTRGRCR
jgi:hypothetical protein